ncbi:tonB-system energizer ExbB [Brenneria uluponensis]|uniref:tonB-system energizer ExbB n=1 Tax=Brenneria uluponensis TaxID=3057057 RepID=UPI0028EE534D|nr:tonB-system energizer ExbB [Brenneria ulupoensis]
MNTFSEKCTGLRGNTKNWVCFGIALFLLTTVSMTAWAEPQPAAVDAVQPPLTVPVSDVSKVASGVTSVAPVTSSTVTVPAASLPPASLSFSPIALYNHADSIVKTVILILIFASLLSWSIWLGKVWELLVRGRRMRKNLGQLAGKRSLRQCGELAAQSCEQMHAVALSELNYVKGRISQHTTQAIKERVHAQIQRIEAAEIGCATRGASILATTSAVAPFIGLFGTVWGIMHSFISIAQSQTTNLSVVAPGIAEALFATALGLVVAIPAVILYNVIGRLISGYRMLLADAMTRTMCLLSHDLDTMEEDQHNILTSAA